MNNEQRILALAQRIYRTMNKTTNQNVTGDDLTTFINDTIGWVNDFVEELMAETYMDGSPVYWDFLRKQDDVIATATNSHTYPLPEETDTLVVSPYRPLTLQHDGTVVASFKLVNANQIGDPGDHDIVDRATVVNGKLLLSRSLKDEEVGADIVADSIIKVPELSLEDTSLIDIIKPLQLVVLGTAKNWILPDKVSGGLTPSYSQKYDILLENVKRRSRISSQANRSSREDFSNVGGVGF